MDKTTARKIAQQTKAKLTQHSPEILTGIGIAGMITTTVLAVKATPKALQLIEAKKAEVGISPDTPLPAKEVVKATWKCYIPAATTCALSTTCIIGASRVNLRRNAALATAYKISETALAEYRDKVVEVVGEKKAKEIREKINEDKLKEQPVSQSAVIVTDMGNTLCYDSLSGRYFKSDKNKIQRAENIIGQRMLSQEYASLNEFYEEIGLSHTATGYDLGWNIGRDGLLKLDFDSLLADDGTPCLIINYVTPPKYGYSKLV